MVLDYFLISLKWRSDHASPNWNYSQEVYFGSRPGDVVLKHYKLSEENGSHEQYIPLSIVRISKSTYHELKTMGFPGEVGET